MLQNTTPKTQGALSRFSEQDETYVKNEFLAGARAFIDSAGDEIPEEFTCPIEQTLMDEPVFLRGSKAGYTYDKQAITRWLATNETEPMTREVLSDKAVVRNQNLHSRLAEFKQAVKALGGTIDKAPLSSRDLLEAPTPRARPIAPTPDVISCSPTAPAVPPVSSAYPTHQASVQQGIRGDAFAAGVASGEACGGCLVGLALTPVRCALGLVVSACACAATIVCCPVATVAACCVSRD